MATSQSAETAPRGGIRGAGGRQGIMMHGVLFNNLACAIKRVVTVVRGRKYVGGATKTMTDNGRKLGFPEFL